MEKLGARLRCAEGRQSRSDLCSDLGLRAHRALCRASGLRSDRSGHVGPDVDHGRGGGASAMQGRRAGERHHRRHPPRDGCLCGADTEGRDRGGPAGRTSLFEAAITHTYWQSAIAFATGEDPGPMGSAHPLNAPYQGVQTADGYINIGAANQRNWLRLVELIGHPELADDARFRLNEGRMANRAALEAELNAIFSMRPSADWLALLEAGGLSRRSGAFDQRDACRSADDCARDGAVYGASGCRTGANHRAAREVLRNPRRRAQAGADVGPAYLRGPCRNRRGKDRLTGSIGPS